MNHSDRRMALSYDTERYDIEKLPNQSLAVIQWGITRNHPGHKCGPLLYKHYAIHFVTKGKGIYQINGKTYHLERGQGFLIPQNLSNIYTADDQDPWEYHYATFYGPDADTLVHHAGLDEQHVVFSFPTDADTLALLDQIMNCCRKNQAKGYDIIGCFFSLMSRLVAAHEAEIRQTYQTEQYIAKAISYIEDHYPYGISIHDIARFVGLDRSYLYRLFKTSFGVSPSQYLNDYRLKKALELMKQPSLSLHEIALSLGYYDISHFFRSFISYYGMQPGAYRKKMLETTNEGEIGSWNTY